MLMADVRAIFFVVLGLLLAHVGGWLLCRGLRSSHVERSADASRTPALLAGIVPSCGAAVFALGSGPSGLDVRVDHRAVLAEIVGTREVFPGLTATRIGVV
jgi:hypothetical protein